MKNEKPIGFNDNSEPIKMPTFTELIKGGDKLDLLEREAISKQLLNNDPPKQWIKDHPMAKGVKYLPIDKVEYLLNNIFLSWKVEIDTVQLIANSIVTIVRVHYLDRITDKWSYQDGVGAAPIQTDKGANATDFTKVKNNAVMLGAPASESYAIKDACEKIGRIFGADLNRKDIIGYDLANKFTGDKYKNLEE